MLYSFRFTVPAATAQTSPAALTLDLDRGIIHQLDVTFPFGCNDLVFLQLYRGQFQVVPGNRQGSLNGNGVPISGPTWIEIEEEPYTLEARAWSPDTTYAHTITINIWLLPRTILLPPREELTVLQRLSRAILGRSV